MSKTVVLTFSSVQDSSGAGYFGKSEKSRKNGLKWHVSIYICPLKVQTWHVSIYICPLKVQTWHVSIYICPLKV
ncbi:MAG: hypothetical protein WC139_12640, partial [Candidatus Kapaibacterium sp.]